MRYNPHTDVSGIACLFLFLVAPTTASADVVVPSDRVTSRVIVRERATSNSPDIGSLHPGDQFEYLSSVPRWHRIRIPDGTPGFVSKAWTRVIADSATGLFTIDVADVGTGLAW